MMKVSKAHCLQVARFLVLPIALGFTLTTSHAEAFSIFGFEIGGSAKTSEPSSPTLSSSSRGWVTTKDSWSTADERLYSDFVKALGESGCNTVDKCIKSPANPYRTSDPTDLTFYADCADFPYFIRGYFAWKNGLPFSYINDVTPLAGDPKNTRYNASGNKVLGRRILGGPNVKPGSPAQVLQGFQDMRDTISTAMFRFEPSTEDRTFYPDHYPTKVDRQSIRPGSVIYDPNGHAAVIYKIENDGRIRFFDAHPDNSVTHGVYGEKFVRATPGMSSGFKNWRPIKVQDGKFIGALNAEISDYGTEQFYGTTPSKDGWSKGTFEVNGQKVKYYDFVRMKMAVGELRYKPVEEVKGMIAGLCDDLKDRATAVQEAIKKGLDKARHPSELPTNIYGTSGEWESFSTPSRDARLKTSFRELRTRTQEFVELGRQKSTRIEYAGTNLIADLRAAYIESAKACQFTYTRTDGSQVTLNLHQAMERLFDMSFDPYHCPERRWGAQGDELKTCTDEREKEIWFEAEARLRNQLERTYTVANPTTANGLFAKGPGSGVDTPPDVNTLEYLRKAAQGAL